MLATLTTLLFDNAGVRVLAKALALVPYTLSLVILLLSRSSDRRRCWPGGAMGIARNSSPGTCPVCMP